MLSNNQIKMVKFSFDDLLVPVLLHSCVQVFPHAPFLCNLILETLTLWLIYKFCIRTYGEAILQKTMGGPLMSIDMVPGMINGQKQWIAVPSPLSLILNHSQRTLAKRGLQMSVI